MKKTGFYIIKDKFFEDMSDPFLKGNKAGSRPHYYCFEDEQKARKVMGMLKRGVKFTPTQPNVINILEKLRQGK